MSEFKVKFKARINRFLGEGMEIYEAAAAKQAVEMARAEFRELALKNGYDEGEVSITVLDVEALLAPYLCTCGFTSDSQEKIDTHIAEEAAKPLLKHLLSMGSE